MFPPSGFSVSQTLPMAASISAEAEDWWKAQKQKRVEEEAKLMEARFTNNDPYTNDDEGEYA